ncbi:uncharacterized protein PG986_000180 [Apiospora aurea]|uniref:GST N-terminal domain-containing protein n=1 Tax=Apiospora aurea TaxID=335848 RepID=A0ABR1QTC9_9PEZI
MASGLQHTLWLWLEGFFPRRVWYYLLTKGLAASPADLLEGKTVDPSLRINRMHMDMAAGGWKFADPSNPAPQGASTPCLGIHDPATGETRYIYESASILVYLETVYGNREGGGPSAMPKNPVDVAKMHDIIGVMNLAMLDSGYYTCHAVPVLSVWSGVANEDRSRAAALNARAGMAKNLAKVQAWAAPSLKTTGWLTPGTEGPGVADFSLAAARRYLELTFEWDIFEGDGEKEELEELAVWYERFKGLEWWDAAEEHVVVHPPRLRLGKECREF